MGVEWRRMGKNIVRIKSKMEVESEMKLIQLHFVLSYRRNWRRNFTHMKWIWILATLLAQVPLLVNVWLL